MIPTITVYVSIGNSDDKLPQAEWSEFVRTFIRVMRRFSEEIYGVWHSEPSEPYQNACVAASVYVGKVDVLRGELIEMRDYYQQESVAWAVVAETEFI